VRQVSWRKTRPNRQFVLYALGTVAIFALFFAFFFWSRAAVIAGG
jgi:hypothetical protein